MMTWEEKLEKAVGVLMRVPPLFLMDFVMNMLPYDPQVSWKEYFASIGWFVQMIPGTMFLLKEYYFA